VEWMLRVAAGEGMPAAAPPARGAAIQARIYAEDPLRGFQPSAGVLTEATFPDDVRVEAAVDRGSEVSPYYDPLLAKLIAKGDTREEARARLLDATAATREQSRRCLLYALPRPRLAGVETNRELLRTALGSAAFVSGDVSTRLLDQPTVPSHAIEGLASRHAHKG